MNRIALVIVTLLAASTVMLGATGCSRVSGVVSAQPTQPITVTIVAQRVNDPVPSQFHVGDPVKLKDSGALVGKIVSVSTSRTVEEVPTAIGTLRAANSPVTYDVTVQVAGNGVVDDNGTRVNGAGLWANDVPKFVTPYVMFSGLIAKVESDKK